MQKTRGPRRTEDILHSVPEHPPRQRGDQDLYVAQSSLYTSAVMHPLITTAAIASAVAVAMVLAGRRAATVSRRIYGPSGLL